MSARCRRPCGTCERRRTSVSTTRRVQNAAISGSWSAARTVASRHDSVAHLRPGIVYVTLSAYGHTGPWRERRGFETLIQSATGMTHEHGFGGGLDHPEHLPARVVDHGAGYLAALGALIALARRARRRELSRAGVARPDWALGRRARSRGGSAHPRAGGGERPGSDGRFRHAARPAPPRPPRRAAVGLHRSDRSTPCARGQTFAYQKCNLTELRDAKCVDLSHFCRSMRGGA